MKVLQVLSSTNVNSGIANVVINYYRHIDREKVQFDFLAFWEAPNNYDHEIESLGGKVYYFTQPGLKTYFKSKKELEQFVSAHKGEYDVIHCHEILISKMVFKTARKYGNPVCISHSHNSRLSDGLIKKIRNRIIITGLSKKSNYCFACSKDAAVKAFGKKILKSKKYCLIYNAINLEKFRFLQSEREQIREELGLGNSLVLGNVGRLCYQKNQSFAVEVLREVIRERGDVKLLLVGEGPDKDNLIKRIEKYDMMDNVVFTGIRHDIPQLLSAMDYFVFPSIYEGLGIALVEAQTNGLLSVCFDDLPEEVFLTDLIKGFDKNESASEWAKWILQTSKQSIDRQKGYIQVKQKNFDIKDSAECLAALYLSMVKTK